MDFAFDQYRYSPRYLLNSNNYFDNNFNNPYNFPAQRPFDQHINDGFDAKNNVRKWPLNLNTNNAANYETVSTADVQSKNSATELDDLKSNKWDWKAYQKPETANFTDEEANLLEESILNYYTNRTLDAASANSHRTSPKSSESNHSRLAAGRQELNTSNMMYRSHNRSNVNFIILMGLLFVLLLSHTVYYLQHICSWMLRKAKQLHCYFFGNLSLLDFCDLEETSCREMCLKLLLLPIMGCCSFLYGAMVFVHYALKLLVLAHAPNALLNLRHKLS